MLSTQFDVLTNHAPNQYILSQQKLSYRQVRWVEVLAEYAVNFIYKQGRIHSAPDALSRILTLNAVGRPQLLLEAIRLAQSVSIDKEIWRFKDLVSNPTSDFILNQGLLVKLAKNSSPIAIPGDARQLQQKILQELHTSPLGGHLGYCKLLELIHTRFWWLHLNTSVQEFCYQCVLCQQTKVVTQKLLGLLQLLEPPSRPFEQVTMDLITHLPDSVGHSAVFTMVERLSKYVTFLLSSTTSTTLDLALLFYDHIVCKFGMPVKIVSYRDSRILSNFQ